MSSYKAHSPRLETFLAVAFIIAIAAVGYSISDKVHQAPKRTETVCFQFSKGPKEP